MQDQQMQYLILNRHCRRFIGVNKKSWRTGQAGLGVPKRIGWSGRKGRKGDKEKISKSATVPFTEQYYVAVDRQLKSGFGTQVTVFNAKTLSHTAIEQPIATKARGWACPPHWPPAASRRRMQIPRGPQRTGRDFAKTAIQPPRRWNCFWDFISRCGETSLAKTCVIAIT
jgi:hypothetical protein